MSNSVLIVDDDSRMRLFLEKAFIRAGFAPQTVGSGEKALELLKSESFAIMFVDLNMPGMDGIELCRRIRQENNKAPIYAITGYSDTYPAEECDEAGFTGVFPKPLDLPKLLDTTRQATERAN